MKLTNSFTTSVNELKNKIKKTNYKYIIAFGQKLNSDHPYIEVIGNKNNNKLKSNFNYEALMTYLETNEIKISLSNDAGNYLCNNIYYEGMKYIQDKSLDIKMVFIHVPLF